MEPSKLKFTIVNVDDVKVSSGAKSIICTCINRGCPHLGLVKAKEGSVKVACTIEEQNPIMLTKESVANCVGGYSGARRNK